MVMFNLPSLNISTFLKMARKRTEPRKIGNHKAENMLRALILHRQGTSIRKAARDSHVHYRTLSRYVKKYANISTEELKNQRLTPHYSVNKIFTVQQEAELTAFIKDCGNTKALSTKDVRRAAYELAAVNDIEVPENWEREQMAGIDWLQSFKKRNFGPNQPEALNTAIEDVAKELIDGNKVCSLNKALNTLEVSVVKVSDGANPECEDSNLFTEKLKSNTIDLDANDEDIVEVNANDDSDLMLALTGIDGAIAFGDGKRGSDNVKVEMELQLDEGCSQDPLSDEEEAEESSTVWGYYEREGPRARCVVCRAVVSRNELKSHLRAKHPKLVSEVDLGSDDEASDTQEDLYTEIVYLEDEQNARKQKSTPKPKPKPKSYTERSEPRKRLPSSSSDEAPLRRRKTKTDDEPANIEEIEQFGKYVTCLLKKIPPAACMELQAEIINLIMKKQLELKRNEMSVLAGNIMAETVNDRTDGFESTPSASNFISNGSNVIENKE